MTKKNLVQITTDQRGSEVVMVRVDRTVKELMEEKPSVRWDPVYWHPSVTKVLDILRSTNVNVLGFFIKYITYGVITTGAERKYDVAGEVWHINQVNVRNTGLDIYLDERKIKKNDKRNSERCKPKNGDVLFNRDQVGTMGRCCVFLYDSADYVINDHVDIIRVDEINPFYVCVYLLTKFGSSQVNRFGSGVSGIIGITFDQIKAIKIPILPPKVQEHIESEYKKMAVYHDKAVEAKKDNDEAVYKNNLEIAGKMLKDLIAKTETVIRGEREDVID